MYIIVSVYISRIFLTQLQDILKHPKCTKYPSVLTLWNFCKTNFSKLPVSFFLGGSGFIYLLFNNILKYMEEHATKKLNTKLFYQNSTTFPYTSLIKT